jgi:ABC-2 type transport system permease protein
MSHPFDGGRHTAYTSKQEVVRKRQDIINFVFAVIVLVLLNLIAQFKFFRWDLTAEKRFTISEPTRELLRELDEPVMYRVYLDGDFPAGFRRLRDETRNMLTEFRAYSDLVEFEFIDPTQAETDEQRNELYQQLQNKGLEPTQLEVKNNDQKSEQWIFPGGFVYHKGKEGSFKLLKTQFGLSAEAQLNNSVQALEFELANALRKLQIEQKKRIAFLEGHGELDEVETKSIAAELSKSYSTERFDLRAFEVDSITGEISLSRQIVRLNSYDAIVIAKPIESFTDLDKFLIDQFVMKGGKVLWFLDVIQAEMDSLQNKDQTLAYPYPLNLEDQLFKYGVRINNEIVKDLVCGSIPLVVNVVNNQPQFEMFPWTYFPMYFPEIDHAIVKNINPIRFEFPSSIDTIKTTTVKKTPLLFSSEYTDRVQAPTLINLSELRSQPREEDYRDLPACSAILLEGQFESLFKNRIQPRDESGTPVKVAEQSVPTAMLVVSDGDVIRNQVQNGQALPLGYDKYMRQQFGNRDFLMNAFDYLLDDSGLIEVRSREIQLRLLDKKRVEAEKTRWKMINTLVPALLFIGLGWLSGVWRRRKYRR